MKRKQADALHDILKRRGVVKFVDLKKKEIKEAIVLLVSAYRKVFPNEPCDILVIGPLVWDIVRWETSVRNVFLLQGFNMDELHAYGGPVSQQIVAIILRTLNVDIATFNQKVPS